MAKKTVAKAKKTPAKKAAPAKAKKAPARKSAAVKKAKAAKYVYFFGGGKADGDRTMKDLPGGKGSGLAEMTNAGVPVPPGFTISTQACNAYYDSGGKLPAEVDQQTDAALARLEGQQGR